MNIIELPIDSIIPYENNPRDNDEAVEFVANCIRRFGFRNPIQVDENNVILCGHTRLLACLSLGMENVPCIRHEGLTEAEKAAYRLADNKVAEIAKWDFGKLDDELKKIGDEINMQDFGFAYDEPSLDEPVNQQVNNDDGSTLIVICETAEERNELKTRLEDEGYECRIVKK